MKSMFLSVVIICALAISAVGGTLATWSDSEVSEGNYVNTGSVDLKVNGQDDLPWGTGVGPKVEIECMVPCKWYGPYEVELWNAGQCEFPSKAFIHLKDISCYNLDPKVHPETGGSTGYLCPVTGDLKPEPELVAESGGKVNCIEVPGVGIQGDECSVGSHVEMVITTTDIDPTTNDFADVLVNPDGRLMRAKMKDWECKELYLFDLMPCDPRVIYLWFHLQQESEEDYGLDLIDDPMEEFFPADDDYDAKYLHWQKFNDWPSWSMMKDGATFDLEFDLWLVDP